MKDYKSLCRIFTLLVLLLLSLYQEVTSAKSPDRYQQFLAAHTVDPGLRPGTWNSQKWINWLGNTADPAYKRAGGKNDLLQKSINTVLVATPSTIQDNFVKNQQKPVPDSEYRWSRGSLDTYVIQKKGSSYDVRHCPPLYSRVAYSKGQPVHYGQFYPTPQKGNGAPPNYSANTNCQKVN